MIFLSDVEHFPSWTSFLLNRVEEIGTSDLEMRHQKDRRTDEFADDTHTLTHSYIQTHTHTHSHSLKHTNAHTHTRTHVHTYTLTYEGRRWYGQGFRVSLSCEDFYLETNVGNVFRVDIQIWRRDGKGVCGSKS